jgi:hypothetical protein
MEDYDIGIYYCNICKIYYAAKFYYDVPGKTYLDKWLHGHSFEEIKNYIESTDHINRGEYYDCVCLLTSCVAKNIKQPFKLTEDNKIQLVGVDYNIELFEGKEKFLTEKEFDILIDKIKKKLMKNYFIEIRYCNICKIYYAVKFYYDPDKKYLDKLFHGHSFEEINNHIDNTDHINRGEYDEDLRDTIISSVSKDIKQPFKLTEDNKIQLIGVDYNIELFEGREESLTEEEFVALEDKIKGIYEE